MQVDCKTQPIHCRQVINFLGIHDNIREHLFTENCKIFIYTYLFIKSQRNQQNLRHNFAFYCKKKSLGFSFESERFVLFSFPLLDNRTCSVLRKKCKSSKMYFISIKIINFDTYVHCFFIIQAVAFFINFIFSFFAGSDFYLKQVNLCIYQTTQHFLSNFNFNAFKPACPFKSNYRQLLSRVHPFERIGVMTDLQIPFYNVGRRVLFRKKTFFLF